MKQNFSVFLFVPLQENLCCGGPSSVLFGSCGFVWDYVCLCIDEQTNLFVNLGNYYISIQIEILAISKYTD